ncbi:hypothetical protein CTAYLR_010614 [Chrysophaeum taylorii]|uniref:DNA-directed RNA polymerase n=1 Tax=Chrysophaeum taylorii TaxID=2483200 RepID=A0AAD7U6P1_9STRA|nr:hypothetical protein CTAYLR_010614 [Chrysophaeum taylorii]
MDVDRPSTAKTASSNWKKRLTVTAAHAMRDRMHIQLDVKVPASRPRVAILAIIEQSCGSCVVVPGVAEATPVEDRVVVRGNDIHALWSAATTTTSDSADLDNLHCNDVRAVMATYGVEAARATLIREIQSVFGVYGIVVGPRHLSLVGDKVMFHGEHHAMNRIYMGLHSSPWLKMRC